MTQADRAKDAAELSGRIGWWGVAAASIGLVVASTTFAGDFNGYGIAGPGYLLTLLFGLTLNLFVAFAYAELTTIFSETGQVFDFTKRCFADWGSQPATLLAAGIGTTYWLVFGLVWASETVAGAHAMVQATNLGTVTLWILVLNGIAIGINMLGIRLTITMVTILVLCMIGIRMAMGVAAFSGLNLLGRGGDFGVLFDTSSYRLSDIFKTLPLGIWAFIGLEFSTPLVKEVRDPSTNIPRGMIIGAFTILVMALTMGVGIITTFNPLAHPSVYTGNAPQIEIAGVLFGAEGRLIAGLASFLATMGSLLIAYAAIPRILYAMARQGAWPKKFAWLHPRFLSPWPATLATGAIILIPSLFSTDVVSLIRLAAVVWLLTYVWVLVLAIKFRFSHPDLERPFKRHIGFYVLGILLILFVFWKAYSGAYHLIAIGLTVFVLGFAFAKLYLDNFGTALSNT
ncbi:APC family permease [Haloplanus halobius]|uniref:APC family permease n=1 Tax=Haloplanus halobius TaxID=2934938 RepID=UPI002010B08A|nr:APC family permease [Haloplanus sp. XH21]